MSFRGCYMLGGRAVPKVCKHRGASGGLPLQIPHTQNPTGYIGYNYKLLHSTNMLVEHLVIQ